MGTGWKYYTKASSRPKKAATDRKRRVKVQTKRLAKMGMSGAVLAKMNSKQIRESLKCPAKLKKQLATK
jgi:hypothetical protein